MNCCRVILLRARTKNMGPRWRATCSRSRGCTPSDRVVHAARPPDRGEPGRVARRARAHTRRARRRGARGGAARGAHGRVRELSATSTPQCAFYRGDGGAPGSRRGWRRRRRRRPGTSSARARARGGARGEDDGGGGGAPTKPRPRGRGALPRISGTSSARRTRCAARADRSARPRPGRRRPPPVCARGRFGARTTARPRGRAKRASRSLGARGTKLGGPRHPYYFSRPLIRPLSFSGADARQISALGALARAAAAARRAAAAPRARAARRRARSCRARCASARASASWTISSSRRAGARGRRGVSRCGGPRARGFGGDLDEGRSSQPGGAGNDPRSRDQRRAALRLEPPPRPPAAGSSSSRPPVVVVVVVVALGSAGHGPVRGALGTVGVRARVRRGRRLLRRTSRPRSAAAARRSRRAPRSRTPSSSRAG